MRKSGKLLLGVLSVAALIGTGMGAFIINGTYGSDTDTIGVTTTEEYYSRGFNITAEKAADDGINFDGTGGDLLVTYTVKAKAIDGGFTQDALYNPETWNAVAKEHRPNLKISATHTNADETRAAAFNKYVVLPDVATISYETWLAANLKETGYTYEFKVEWKKEALGGHSTPNEYFATVDNATGKEVYDEIKSGLEYAKITVTFEAGYYEGGSTVEPTPSVDTTGAVTLPDATSNALLSITGTQEDGTIEAGEQTLSLTLEEGYELDTAGLTVAVDDADPVKIDMVEDPTQAMSLNNPGKKYTGTYTFVAGSTYAFSVSVKEIQAEPPVEIKYANVSLGATENGTINYTAGQVEVNSAVTFKVTPDQYYKVDTVSYTLDSEEPQTLTANEDGEYSFVAAKENGSYVINATFVLDETSLPYTKISSVNEKLAEIGDYESLEGTFTIRGYITGMTDLTIYNNRSSVFIADGNSSIVLYRPTLEILGAATIGSLVEIDGTAEKYNGTAQFIASKVTILDTDKTVETPVVYDLNDNTVADFAFDTTNGQSRKVNITGAVVKSVNNRYFDITVGQTDFTIYLTQNDNLVAWDEIQIINAGVKFDCTAFVGQYKGSGQFVGISDFVAYYDTGVAIEVANEEALSLEVGGFLNLDASVSPSEAYQGLTYEITDGADYIDLNGNTIEAKVAGTATVTISSSKYSLSKVVSITVTAPSVQTTTYSYDCTTSSEASLTDTKLVYDTSADFPFEISHNKGPSGQTKPAARGDNNHVKVYGKNYLAFVDSTASHKIYKIELVASTSSYIKNWGVCDSTGVATENSNVVISVYDTTATISITDGLSELYLINTEGSQARLTTINVYYI